MTLKECYDRMPPEAQEEFWKVLGTGMRWRGWDAGRFRPPESQPHTLMAVEELADLFSRHGCEVEEYT